MLEALRKHSLITGAQLAAILEVSVRTVYRDIDALASVGVPIRGEAGLGYVLDSGYFLPPLSLTAEEFDVLTLGARALQRQSNPELASKVEIALDKIRAVLPPATLTTLRRELVWAPRRQSRFASPVDPLGLRRAAETRKIIALEYSHGVSGNSTQDVRPLSLTLLKGRWVLIGWCEQSERFRLFQLDRIIAATPTDCVFRDEEGKRLRDCPYFWKGPQQLPG